MPKYLSGFLMLAVVFCNSPTKHASEDFKVRILNNSDECTWYSLSDIRDTVKNAFLIDTVDSAYNIESIISLSVSSTTYKFTRDSIFIDYRGNNHVYAVECGPFFINNGDTIPGDSVLCHTSISGIPAFDITLKKGTWGCDRNNLNFHYTGIAECKYCPGPNFVPDYTDVDTTEQSSFYFSNNGDTLYIEKDGSFSGFVKITN